MQLSNSAFTVPFALGHSLVHSHLNISHACSMDSLTVRFSSIDSPLAANATILSVVPVKQNGSYGDPNPLPGIPFVRVATGLPELCAVEINVTSSETSSYTLSLFLPSEWNSRLLTVGGGGTAGYINWPDMGAGTHYGFATLSTDNGHRSGPYDVAWAWQSPEKQVDWAWRAMHGSVRLAKQLVAAYYGEAIKYSYYTGCSTGGRQGLKEAQVDAASFDGMLVGAPAWWISHLVSWVTKMSKDYYPLDDPKSVPSSLLPLISSTVAGQCDAVDGVADGIVSSPERCYPDLEVLNCDNAGADASACLTPRQLETLRKFYADYYVGTELAFPGFDLSSEGGWGNFLWNATPLSYGLDYMRTAVLEDLDWPLAAYNDSVYEYAKAKDMGHPEPDDFDMAAYRDRGGKILMYHGIADPLIVTRGSTYLYEQVKLATAGSASTRPIADWFKFFLIPGMQHCLGTAVDAPWYINGADQSFLLGSDQYSVPGFKDSRHDALLALMEWVEHGKDFDRIIATSWNVLADPSSGVSRQRPLCPYPKKAVYDGVGNGDKADSWNCE